MAELEKQAVRNAEPAPETTADEKGSGRFSRLRTLLGRLLTRKWIAGLLILSIVVHLMGIVYYQVFARGTVTVPSPEIALGEFEFAAGESELGQITGAKFHLHVSLLDHVDREARYQLHTRAFRVQQDVEELLRLAHGGNFVDPKLSELKRRLQEQVNATLGIRVIADVIVTDLKLQRRELEEVEAITEAAEPAPWFEQPAVEKGKDDDLAASGKAP